MTIELTNVFTRERFLINRILQRATEMELVKDYHDYCSSARRVFDAYVAFNLRLAEWLEADDFEFSHDFNGIRDNVVQGVIDDDFIPRFAGEGKAEEHVVLNADEMMIQGAQRALCSGIIAIGHMKSSDRDKMILSYARAVVYGYVSAFEDAFYLTDDEIDSLREKSEAILDEMHKLDWFGNDGDELRNILSGRRFS